VRSQHPFYIINVRYEMARLRILLTSEIGREPILEHFSFADIDNLRSVVSHKIDARAFWCLLDKRFYTCAAFGIGFHYGFF